ncbi:TPA: hypothetical protein DF272_00295 [Candidatus Falkowbacteria bacterium]|nr:hypothetical protein [Candidatus Falkowbacteria bacterium]
MTKPIVAITDEERRANFKLLMAHAMAWFNLSEEEKRQRDLERMRREAKTVAEWEALLGCDEAPYTVFDLNNDYGLDAPRIKSITDEERRARFELLTHHDSLDDKH